jgi:hypothetical protein
MADCRIGRLSQAIAECNDYIAKESARSADLRPIEIQKRLEWYIAHRMKLIGMRNNLLGH